MMVCGEEISIMKKLIALIFVCLWMPLAAVAQEDGTQKKGFWESLVPDNSSAIEFVDQSKNFFGQLFEDTKDTGKVLLDGGKSIIGSTADKVKEITTGDE